MVVETHHSNPLLQEAQVTDATPPNHPPASPGSLQAMAEGRGTVRQAHSARGGTSLLGDGGSLHRSLQACLPCLPLLPSQGCDDSPPGPHFVPFSLMSAALHESLHV